MKKDHILHILKEESTELPSEREKEARKERKKNASVKKLLNELEIYITKRNWPRVGEEDVRVDNKRNKDGWENRAVENWWEEEENTVEKRRRQKNGKIPKLWTNMKKSNSIL